MKTLTKSGILLSLFASFMLFSSCEDTELNILMEEYCECINESRNDSDKSHDCIELMNDINSKYANQPNKLKKVLELTDTCY